MEENEKENNNLDLVGKAKYIFDLCDKEGNGIINKADLLKLKTDLPLSQEQLLSVFESLDIEGKGFLTHREFISAFRKYAIAFEDEYPQSKWDELYSADSGEDHIGETTSKSEHLNQLIKSLSQSSVLKDLDTIRSLWSELSEQGDTALLSSFESLITEVVSVINTSQVQYHALKDTLHKQRLCYNEELYAMCTEVESRRLQESIDKEERERERRMRAVLLQQLREKDHLLQELKVNLTAIEAQYEDLNNKKSNTDNGGVQNDEKEEEEEEEEEEKEKEKKDAADKGREKEGGDVFVKEEADNDEDENVTFVNKKIKKSVTSELSEWMEVERQHLISYISQLERKNQELQDVQDELEDRILFPKKQHTPTTPGEKETDLKTNNELTPTPEVEIRTPKRKDSSAHHKKHHNKRNHSNAHLFRVVFVGDSGVGKTSLLHRACRGEFNPSLPSTLGLDSHMCSRKVQGWEVLMQLWDTAGQERFRSFSQQYFRKADAVVAAYDISKPASFVNLRAWMHHIQEAVEKDTVLLLLGTKLDMLKQRPFPVVTSDAARRLAVETGASFFETSALDGHNVEEAFMYLATVLRERHEKLLQASLTYNSPSIRLHPFKKTSNKCCASLHNS